MTLLIIWLVWTTLAIAFGLLVGLCIREADRIEQPEADTAEIRIPREWVA